MNGRAAALGAALWVGAVPAALAASADFYPLAQRWAKSRAETSAKDGALEGVFQRAGRGDPRAASGAPEPLPMLRRALSALAPGESLELESGQVLLLSSETPIAKFASLEESVIELERVDVQTLAVTAREVGKTVVHVWDASRRTTFEVRVIPRKITGPTYLDLKRDEIQKTRPFRVRFTADGGTFHSGEKFREMNRTSLDAAEALEIKGDTPYGFLESRAQIQRSGLETKNLLTEASVSLKDGRVGPFRNFNAVAGDSVVKPDFLVFSRGRVRGAAGDTWTDDRRFELSGFFGREEAGIFAPLSPSAAATERTIDSFLSGTVASYRASDDLKMRAGYFTGYGKSRPDELNRQGIGLSADAALGPHVTLLPETDFDTEHVVHRHAVLWRDEKAELRSEFRNINENFQSMIGAPAQQGELGGRFDATVRPWERWRWKGVLDVFKDRRIPNPDLPGARNVHAESEIFYEVADRASLSFTWRDRDDTGRVSPARERSFGLQYTESFDAFGRALSANVRGTHRGSRSLTQSVLNYDRSELSLGLFVPLGWDVHFSVQKEWHWLNDVELPEHWSQPEALTLGLAYSHRLWDSPFYVDMNFRWRDEEETESRNSFMAGEDSAEISGGLYYRETEDLELYLKGQLQNFNPESLVLTDNRVEAQVTAGMRWDWDTGIRWGGVGHVRGSVFKDENRNGTREPDEPGLAQVTVESAAGARVVTDADGYYEIRGIVDRSAVLTVEATHLPAGYAPTAAVVQQVEIPSGEWITVDFGFAPRSEVAGVVFNDLDGDGKFAPSEPGVARVRFKLDGKAASSSSSGSFAFRGLAPGPHEIGLDLASVAEGFLPVGDVRKRFELSEGMRYEWNVPLRAHRAVSGRAYRDRDGNGAFSLPEDAPIAAAVVQLGPHRQKTDDQGRFLFDQLSVGRYELSLDRSALSANENLPAPVPLELGAEPQTLSGIGLAVTSGESGGAVKWPSR